MIQRAVQRQNCNNSATYVKNKLLQNLTLDRFNAPTNRVNEVEIAQYPFKIHPSLPRFLNFKLIVRHKIYINSIVAKIPKIFPLQNKRKSD